MPQKPARSPRFRKRLPVRFGTTADMPCRGFTMNLSSQGLAVATNAFGDLDGRLFVEIIIDGQPCMVAGHARWVHRGLAGVGAIGVLLDAAQPGYQQLMAQLAPGQTVPPPAPKKPAPPPEPAPAKKDPDEIDFDSTEWWVVPEKESEFSRAPRFDADLPMHFGAGGKLDQSGIALNVSSTGIALSAPNRAELGEKVAFAITSDGGICRGDGEIMWVREVLSWPRRVFVGIRILKHDNRYKQLMAALAREQLPSSAPPPAKSRRT